MSINELVKSIHQNAVDHGFHDIHATEAEWFSAACNNLSREVSELWEAERNGTLRTQCDKPVALTCLEEELADIVIRAMDMAGRMKVDLEQAIALKHGYNQTRPFRHGGKKA